MAGAAAAATTMGFSAVLTFQRVLVVSVWCGVVWSYGGGGGGSVEPALSCPELSVCAVKQRSQTGGPQSHRHLNIAARVVLYSSSVVRLSQYTLHTGQANHSVSHTNISQANCND